jgi:hypothetical protein
MKRLILFADPLADHAAASARSRRLEGEALRQRDMPLSLAMDPGLARNSRPLAAGSPVATPTVAPFAAAADGRAAARRYLAP